jgi:hypothetical protein
MKKTIRVISLIFFIGILSCTSTRVEEKPVPEVQIPKWFHSIKGMQGFFIGTAIEKSTHLDYAFKRAIQKAFSDVVKDIESKVEGTVFFKREEVDQIYRDELKYAFELTTQKSLSGIRILRQEVMKRGFYYYVFLAVAIPTSLFAEQFEEVLASSQSISLNSDQIRLLKKWKEKKSGQTEPFLKKALTGSFQYPAWFINQKENVRGFSVVGYAKPAYYKENAVPLAIKNALENFLLFTQNHVVGKMVNYLRWNENFIRSGTVQEEINKGIIGQLEKNFSVLDTVYLKAMTLVLLGNGSIENRKMVTLTELPEWIYKIPEEEGYYYVIGVSPVFEYEKNSWLEAEKDAREKLALYKMTTLYGREYFDQKRSYGVNEISIDVRLSDVEVVSRARDDYLMYVLTRIKK